MRFILSFAIFTVFGFAQQSCQKVTTASMPAPNKSEAAKTNSTAAATAPADSHSDDAARISLADAKKAFDEGNVVFVDTRAESGYKTEHIKGAMNIPSGEFETRYAEVPKDKKIIAYCS